MSIAPEHDTRLSFDAADRLRRALRVSSVNVQEMAEYLGVSRGTVSNWINGRIVPDHRTMRLFALRTGFPLEWLETGDDPDSPESPNSRTITPVYRLSPGHGSSNPGRLAAISSIFDAHDSEVA